MTVPDTFDRRPAASSSPETLRGRLRWLASELGDEPFLVLPALEGPPTTITYGEMDQLARRVGALLNSVRVSRGEAVHLHLRNTWQFVAAFLGCAELGAVAVPTSPSATVDDVAFIASQAGCTVSIAAADLVPVVRAAREMAPEIGYVFSVGGAADDTLDFDGALAAADPLSAATHLSSSDLAAVLYTSGTTGWPKGAMLTNANLTFAGEAVSAHLRMRVSDRWLISLPLFHMNALGYSLMSAFSSGASAVVVDGFRPEDFGRLARTSEATLASLFTVHIRQILSTPSSIEDDDNRLRVTMFAQQIATGERSEFEGRFGSPLLHVYGLTETLAPTLSEPVNGPRVNGTLGRPTLWSRVRVVDRSGQEVQQGQRGELEVHGTVGVTLPAGYLRHPELMEDSVHDGWFRTGDQMVVDGDGRYVFLGRRLDLVKPAVDNVSTAEIERVLLEHVSVLEVAVVGVAGPDGNESICAFVVLRPSEKDATEDEILGWVRERLAEHKVPSRMVLLEELPRSPVGKVLKRQLQAYQVERKE
ncbi:MAG: AMP-binding protein [Acidimicrobiia bacterium]|jgi:acyl-CoA synthetase (AMP-forming)/AMP-acid ligase II|nr:AMP-binding protein [Acidimicrobiia bacterium]